MNRFFTDQPLTQGSTATLPASVQKHAIQVLRLQEGAQIEVVSRNHQAFVATI